MTNFTPTERTKIRRNPDRGSYDRELIYSILDEAFVCHVAFIADGLPFVVPTNYVRVGDRLFLHGSMVLAVPLVEASAKVRTGFAVDHDEDYAGPAWTGVLPMKWAAQPPVPDPRGNTEIPVPANILY